MKQYYTGVGSRATPPDILSKMRDIAREKEKVGLILRSGAAAGADAAFESGVTDPTMKEIWLPWARFNGHTSKNLPSPRAISMVSHYHPNPNGLNDVALRLHARNIHQVLGADLDDPSIELICWTPNGDLVGGTATALRIAMEHKIPILNLGK